MLKRLIVDGPACRWHSHGKAFRGLYSSRTAENFHVSVASWFPKGKQKKNLTLIDSQIRYVLTCHLELLLEKTLITNSIYSDSLFLLEVHFKTL